MKSCRSLLSIMCFLALVVMLVSFRARSDPKDLERFHIDEVYWIGSTYYYHLAWTDRDWSHSDWQLLPARENPSLGKYAMGAWLELHGKRVTDINLLGTFFLHLGIRLPRLWGEGETYEKRAKVVARIDPEVVKWLNDNDAAVSLDPELLRIGRNFSLLLGMLSTVGVYLIGVVTRNAFTGIVSAYVFSHHPVFVDAYHLAMIDAVSITFSIYVILCFLVLIIRLSRHDQRRHDRWIKWFVGIATAIFVAMACGSKMNSLVVVGTLTVVVALCVAEAWTKYGTRLCTWFISNGEDSRIIRFVIGQGDIQDEPPIASVRLPNEPTLNLHDACRRIAVWGFGILASGFLLFVLFNPTLLQDPIGGLNALFEEHRITGGLQAIYVGSRLSTPAERWPFVFDRLLWNPLWNVIILAAFIWHVALIFRRRDTSFVVLLWWTISLVMILAWVPFNWTRYFLPLIPPTAILLGRTYADCMTFICLAVIKRFTRIPIART